MFEIWLQGLTLTHSNARRKPPEQAHSLLELRAEAKITLIYSLFNTYFYWEKKSIS